MIGLIDLILFFRCKNLCF